MAKPVITDKPIIDQAEYNGVTIWRKEGGSIEVSDTNFSSVKSALIAIARRASIKINNTWNTQYLGWYLIKYLNADISIPKESNEIHCELELSQQYDLELDEKDMVVLSKTNVAKVEAMIRNDSDYLQIGDKESSLTGKSKGSTAYWVGRLKKIYEGNCELSDRVVVENLVRAIDRENSTHLNSDTVGITQMTDRIMKILHSDLLPLLKDPGKEYKLVSILSAPTIIPEGDKLHKSRQNYSFATKFCHYVCFYLYEGRPEQDNYSIYDYVVKSAIPYYADQYAVKYKESDFKDYLKYIDIIDKIIAASKSGISRNGFDHLLWYFYKGRMELIKT